MEADLARLADAVRADAGPGAARRLSRLTPTGDLEVPVPALHSTGDGMAVPEHESAYTPRLKRAVYTERGGHGCFTAPDWGGDFQFKPTAPAFVAYHPKPFPR